MSLQGVLSDFGVADIFQLIAQQRKTGILGVERDGRALEVHFFEGGVLRALPQESRPDAALAGLLIRTGVISEAILAEGWRRQEETLESLPRVLVSSRLIEREVIDAVRRLLTDETIFELFLWDTGSFLFRPCEVERTDSDAPVGAEMVLLDALRMRDEWTQIEGELLDLSVVVARVVSIDQFHARLPAVQASTGMDAQQLERLFTLVDGKISARRVIDLSRAGTFYGGRALVGMMQEGLLSLEMLSDAAGASASAQARPERRLFGYAVLALCTLLAVLFLWLPGPVAVGDYPLPEEALDEARAAASTERLRAALEVYRWAAGSYPKSLEELHAATALAPLSVDGYSYARSPEGYTLQRRRP